MNRAELNRNLLPPKFRLTRTTKPATKSPRDTVAIVKDLGVIQDTGFICRYKTFIKLHISLGEQ